MEGEPEQERLRRTDGIKEEANQQPTGMPVIDLDTAFTLHQLSLKAQGASPNTLRTYASTERDFLAFLRLSHPIALLSLGLLNMENARAWLLRLQARELAPSSLQVRTTILKTWAKFLTVEEYLPRNPIERLKVVRAHAPVIQTFSPEQLGAMMRAAERGPLGWRNVAVLYFLVATGVRAAELCSLRVEDLDIHHGTAIVTGKGRKQRRVHFDATTSKMLIRWLAVRKSSEPWLFVARDGRRWTPAGLSHLVRTVGESAGVTGVRISPHTFRHTYALSFARAYPGATFQLQDYMGHSDPGTTRRYVRFADNEAPLPGPGVVALLGLDKLARR